MPPKTVTQLFQVHPHGGMIDAEACALASAHPFGLLARTVDGDQSSMLEHCLRLTQHAYGSALHHNIRPSAEQALFIQGAYCRGAIVSILDPAHTATRCTIGYFDVVGEIVHGLQLRWVLNQPRWRMRKAERCEELCESRLTLEQRYIAEFGKGDPDF